jgi:hypothetical protein
MKISIKKIHDSNGNEIGSILNTILAHGMPLPNKLQLEYKLIQYAFNDLYKHEEEIRIFREVHDEDAPSIIVMKAGAALPATELII